MCRNKNFFSKQLQYEFCVVVDFLISIPPVIFLLVNLHFAQPPAAKTTQWWFPNFRHRFSRKSNQVTRTIPTNLYFKCDVLAANQTIEMNIRNFYW